SKAALLAARRARPRNQSASAPRRRPPPPGSQATATARWRYARSMKSTTRLLQAALLLALASTPAWAQVNAGRLAPSSSLPFTLTEVATFNLPWRIAFLPDGRMLVTEKVGPIWLVTEHGEKTPVANVPKVVARGQGGMLGVFLSPHYATDHNVYLTY